MLKAILEAVQIGDWIETVTPDGETLEGVAGQTFAFAEDGIAFVQVTLAVGDDWTIFAARADHPVHVG